MTYRVFISHSAVDGDAVAPLYEAARQAGIDAYMFQHDVQAGVRLADKLRTHIAGSDAMIVLLTAQSAASSFVHQEVGVALAANKPVLPLVEKGVGDDRLAMLKGVEYVEFDRQAPDKAVRSIAARLAELRDAKQAREELVLAIGLIAALLLVMYLASQ